MRRQILSIEEYAETMLDIMGENTQVNHMGTDSEGYQVWWGKTADHRDLDIITCREKKVIYKGINHFAVEYTIDNSVRYSFIENTFNDEQL